MQEKERLGAQINNCNSQYQILIQEKERLDAENYQLKNLNGNLRNQLSKSNI